MSGLPWIQLRNAPIAGPSPQFAMLAVDELHFKHPRRAGGQCLDVASVRAFPVPGSVFSATCSDSVLSFMLLAYAWLRHGPLAGTRSMSL